MTSSSQIFRATIALALPLAVAGCPSPRPDAGAAARSDEAAPAALTLPIDDSLAVRLASEAVARFDTASAVASGPRSCDPALPAQRSMRCVLTLTARADVDRFHPDAVPGRYAVLGVVRNTGDLPESRTQIAGGVTAYYLVEQGGGGRARAWYFSVDHGNGGGIVVIRESAYQVCEHEHAGSKPLAAWRRCAEEETVAASDRSAADTPDLPLWYPCGGVCCVDA